MTPIEQLLLALRLDSPDPLGGDSARMMAANAVGALGEASAWTAPADVRRMGRELLQLDVFAPERPLNAREALAP